jgi:hypothetical protein
MTDSKGTFAALQTFSKSNPMLSALAVVAATIAVATVIDRAFRNNATANPSNSLYDFNLKNIKGQEWSLNELKGKVCVKTPKLISTKATELTHGLVGRSLLLSTLLPSADSLLSTRALSLFTKSTRIKASLLLVVLAINLVPKSLAHPTVS